MADRCAQEHFLGKTIADAVGLFQENGLYYLEDLLWMGPKAFCYYLPAAVRYLKSDAGKGDTDAVRSLASIIHSRMHDDRPLIADAHPVIRVSDHVVEKSRAVRCFSRLLPRRGPGLQGGASKTERRTGIGELVVRQKNIMNRHSHNICHRAACVFSLLIALQVSSQAEIEVKNSETNGVLSHYLTCRRPSDISKSSIPGFIRLEFGQTTRHLPVNQIEQVDEQSFGVCIEWPTTRMKNGGGFMATTVCVPPEVMPPEAVFAILGAKNRFSDSRDILPEFELGEEKFRLPYPPHLFRLDDRHLELDLAVRRMAVGAGNRVIALFGSAADDEALREERFPTLKRTIAVQSVVALEDKEVPPGGFPALKDQFKKTLGDPKPEFEDILNRIEKSTAEALTKLTKVRSAMTFGNVVSLGVFAEDDDSLCHSLLADTKGVIGGKELQILQATSVCVLRARTKVVSIYVSAEYGSPADLQWTRETCLAFRNEFREANTNSTSNAVQSKR